jgi:CoA:oxalate CoA-transferase
MGKKALEGVKAVEFCRGVAGSYCSKILADLGAEVVKIEDPAGGDAARHQGPFLGDIPHPERSGLFLYLNTNKLGITLNPQTATGKRIFLRLAKDIDILVEDNPPGMMLDMGLGYEQLGAANSRLIYTSVTPFGQTGPYKHYKAYHLNTFHAGGEGYLLPGGEENANRPPIKAGNWVGEFDSGMQAAVATLGALYWQGLSGSGQYLDISKQEALMSLYASEYPRYFNEDGYVGSRFSQGQPLGGIFPCLDGYVAIIFFDDREWVNLLNTMGRPDLAEDDTFNTRTEAILHRRDEAQAYILEWTMSHTKEELYHQTQKRGTGSAAVFIPEDVVNSEQTRARGFMQELEHPVVGKLQYPLVPYRFSRTPVKLERPAPLLGEHNELIYLDRLGYSREELIRFSGEGVV